MSIIINTHGHSRECCPFMVIDRLRPLKKCEVRDTNQAGERSQQLLTVVSGRPFTTGAVGSVWALTSRNVSLHRWYRAPWVRALQVYHEPRRESKTPDPTTLRTRILFRIAALGHRKTQMLRRTPFIWSDSNGSQTRESKCTHRYQDRRRRGKTNMLLCQSTNIEVPQNPIITICHPVSVLEKKIKRSLISKHTP